MKNHDINNERIKRKYITFMKEAKRHSEASIDCISKAIKRFEEYTKFKDFKAFHFNQAVAFKNSLLSQKSLKTGENLSKSTINGTCNHLKVFFQWLAQQTGYKSRFNYTDADYFNLSEKDTRIAGARRKKPIPTLEQITHVLEKMPSQTDIEKRNRAIMAFTVLTGARDSATASFKVKHVDLVNGAVFQDAREVKTKFSKTFTTYFFPVGELPLQILTEWIEHLKTELLFSHDDPLFPKTKVANTKGKKFSACGVLKEHWSTANPIRDIFKRSFKAAGLQYFNPHSFRDTLVRKGEQLCQSPEEFKAWSQNLGHAGVLTTLYSYGDVPDYLQAELIKKLNQPRAEQSQDMQAVIEATLKKMMDKD
ncbi:site-specific integrase [Colwellia demingiae]|uniref:Site-specific integrase n=1 Tax=Colwellia demingiae TaxID=89401 RepID=A0A5C6QAU7_9GAMM|nr:site-specific integrase [Colwellia demingiae]TWX65948.1 site-specific integrase [Colwellia demingiae]